MTADEKLALMAELEKGFPFSRMKPLSKRGRTLWEAAKRSGDSRRQAGRAKNPMV
jgi:hypothetical protein